MNQTLRKLSDDALIILASREDLTPSMMVVITAELKRRREIIQLQSYYDQSVSGSVLEDYKAGNVRTIKV